MATTPTRLMTFAEFEELPDPRGGGPLELHHGEVIEVAPSKHGRKQRDRQIRRLMEGPAGGAGIVETEVGYRPVPDHEYWVADVMLLSRTRWDAIPSDGYLMEPPELVIEVLSPSNNAAEILEKTKLCLENGSREFWVVDEDYREVKVSTPDRRSLTYRPGQQIPLFFAPGATLRVDDIFA